MSELKYLKNDDKEQVIVDGTIYTDEKAKEIKKKINSPDKKECPVVEQVKNKKEVYLQG